MPRDLHQKLTYPHNKPKWYADQRGTWLQAMRNLIKVAELHGEWEIFLIQQEVPRSLVPARRAAH
jgi:hypothetical protein